MPKSAEQSPAEIEALPQGVALEDDEEASQGPIMDMDWLYAVIDERDRGPLQPSVDAAHVIPHGVRLGGVGVVYQVSFDAAFSPVADLPLSGQGDDLFIGQTSKILKRHTSGSDHLHKVLCRGHRRRHAASQRVAPLHQPKRLKAA